MENSSILKRELLLCIATYLNKKKTIPILGYQLRTQYMNEFSRVRVIIAVNSFTKMLFLDIKRIENLSSFFKFRKRLRKQKATK